MIKQKELIDGGVTLTKYPNEFGVIVKQNGKKRPTFIYCAPKMNGYLKAIAMVHLVINGNERVVPLAQVVYVLKNGDTDVIKLRRNDNDSINCSPDNIKVIKVK